LHYQLEKELLLFLALLWRISGSGSWQYLGLKQYETASVQIFSLWCVSPASNGGLGLTTTDVGQILAISGRLSQSRESHRRVATITYFDDFRPRVDCSMRVITLSLID
jgi:beta-lactamase superfamily II metal-dependent hydrolase